jgi:hypothetical protein
LNVRGSGSCSVTLDGGDVVTWPPVSVDGVEAWLFDSVDDDPEQAGMNVATPRHTNAVMNLLGRAWECLPINTQTRA